MPQGKNQQPEATQSISPAFIIFAGPDHDKSDIELLRKQIAKTGLPPESYKIIGDGKRALTEQEMKEALATSSEHTQIHYFGHGTAKNGKHTIRMVEGKTATEDVMAIGSDRPGTRHLWSCYAGAAKNIAATLGGNPLISHGSEDNSTLIAVDIEGIAAQARLYQQKMQTHNKPPTAEEAFKLSLTFPETVTYSRLVNGKVESFTARPPQYALLRDDSINSYKSYMEEKFDNFRIGLPVQQASQERDVIGNPPIGWQARHKELAMIMAANAGKLDDVTQYLGSGVSADCELLNNTSALIFASMHGHNDIAEALLERGADVNKPGKGGYTALHWASQKGNESLIELLLNKGANINLENEEHETPKELANKSGQSIFSIFMRVIKKVLGITDEKQEEIVPSLAVTTALKRKSTFVELQESKRAKQLPSR
jgi:hypothetical protein